MPNLSYSDNANLMKSAAKDIKKNMEMIIQISNTATINNLDDEDILALSEAILDTLIHIGDINQIRKNMSNWDISGELNDKADSSNR